MQNYPNANNDGSGSRSSKKNGLMGDGKFSTVENNLGEYMLRSIEVDN